jgi:methylphosphotriester-DNA--protein-cysteine methyltransferase
MTCNHDAIFYKTEKLLSRNPAVRLCELEKRLGCSHPTIRKAVLKHRSLGYREYQKQKLLEMGITLLRQGYEVKKVAVKLGYKWPENLTRFLQKTAGCPASKIVGALAGQ